MTTGFGPNDRTAFNEPVELCVGDRIKDNDPRGLFNRVLTIISLRSTFAETVTVEDANGRKFSILRRRIYTDGKPRRSGFSRVQP